MPAGGDVLDIQHIFATLQGEGPYAGHPSVFIRLGGCNLACDFCDTEFESFTGQPLAAVIDRVHTLAADETGKRIRKLVVITGGEPLRQDIVPLCGQLIGQGYSVQIETNGTLYRPLPDGVEIVCSPKNTGKGYFPVREDLLERITAFKFIIAKNDARYDHVPQVGQDKHNTPVYVQPMDAHDEQKNKQNRAYALELAQRYGYILSLQTHKILGIE
jgi:7-carboxy-7-deazaguanine synthase